MSFRALDAAVEEGLAQAGIAGADPVDLVKAQSELIGDEHYHAGLRVVGGFAQPGEMSAFIVVCYSNGYKQLVRKWTGQ